MLSLPHSKTTFAGGDNEFFWGGLGHTGLSFTD
jgi:hypothetical protein